MGICTHMYTQFVGIICTSFERNFRVYLQHLGDALLESNSKSAYFKCAYGSKATVENPNKKCKTL